MKKLIFAVLFVAFVIVIFQGKKFIVSSPTSMAGHGGESFEGDSNFSGESADVKSRNSLNGEGEGLGTSDIDPVYAAKLKQTWQDVQKISLLDGKKQEPLIQIIKKMAQDNPPEFEKFLVEKVEGISLGKVAPYLVFLEGYTAGHPSPIEGVRKIMQYDFSMTDDVDGDGLSAHEKVTMLKGYLIEALAENKEKGQSYKKDPMPVLEGELVRLAKNESHFDLAYQAWVTLKEHYKYDENRLGALIDGRPDRKKFLN